MYMKPTQYLWGKVDEKINTMFKERITFASNWYNYGLNKTQFDKLCIASVILPEEEEMIQKLGTRWLAQSETITARIHDGTDWQPYTFQANIGGRAPIVSPHWNSYSNTAKPVVENETIKNIAQRRREAIHKVAAEQSEFKDSVRKVWEGAPSVNAIAKIWPPVLDLLPPDVVQKIEQKSTRRTTKQMAENIDTKLLSVHILKAKVAQ